MNACNLNIDMIEIPAGNFMMGNNKSPNELPIHLVAVKKFEISKYLITQKQWQDVMGNNPSHFNKSANLYHPVENVSWDDAYDFIGKLNLLTGKLYQLPTEAQWEYACCVDPDDASPILDYAWHYENSDCTTHPVGLKKANAFGLHDMQGNVCEWMYDTYSPNYIGAPNDGIPQIDLPLIGNYEPRRVIRGGSYYSEGAYRGGAAPGTRASTIGFRITRTYFGE